MIAFVILYHTSTGTSPGMKPTLAARAWRGSPSFTLVPIFEWFAADPHPEGDSAPSILPAKIVPDQPSMADTGRYTTQDTEWIVQQIDPLRVTIALMPVGSLSRLEEKIGCRCCQTRRGSSRFHRRQRADDCWPPTHPQPYPPPGGD